MKIRYMKITGIISMSALFVGCATTSAPGISYEEVNADMDRYIATNYSISSLPAEFITKLKQASDAAKKQPVTLEVTQEITTTLNQNKSSTNTRVTQYRNLGDGIIRTIHSFYKNDIAYGKFFSLSYAGIFTIKNQSLSISRRFVSPAKQILGINDFSFNLSNHKPGTVHQATYEIKNFRRTSATLNKKIECTNMKAVNASELEQNLSGKAVELNCKYFSDSNVVQIREYWYLDTYGIAIDKGAKTSSVIIANKNIKFKVK